MWSFWSRDPAKDFAYEINETVPGVEEVSLWVLHKGKRKANGDPVSIFRHEVKAGKEELFEQAKAAVKRLKTLRHPSILTYIDSLETEKFICVVTEFVEPLEKYLQNIGDYSLEQRKFAVSWGLHQVAKGLGFLINDCNLNHNNVFIGSVFVNGTGTWRIWGLEYVTSTSSDTYPSKALSILDKYCPPERASSRPVGPKWSSDSWGLGCLIWEAFNGQLPQASSLKSPGKIPKALFNTLYTDLITNNPNTRPSPLEFIQKSRTSNGFLKNNFIDAMLFLEEIQIKESSEKNRFFTNLDNQMDSFPRDVCKNKILPQLVTAFEYSNAGSAILGPLFKIGKFLEENEYQKKIVPCVIKLFACKDRATRAKLLQQMESFINYLQPNVVNEMVYPHVAQGFLDSNPTIREQTVKCMLHLAPKLNYNNLNEEVLKHFARLQSRDEEGGIRTNTTVCMGKIACHLHPQIRQTVLIPAFLRSMRDPFPPSRIAGILALSATQNFYSLRDTATKVMPALCHLTMDPEKTVREQAFKALKGFISKIDKVSEDPSLAEQMEADLNAAGNTVSSNLSASWAGWAVNSLAAKFYRSKTPTNTSPAAPVNKSVTSSDESKPKERPDHLKSPESEDVEVWGNIEGNLAGSRTDEVHGGWDTEEWDFDPEALVGDGNRTRKVSETSEPSKEPEKERNSNGWDVEPGENSSWSSWGDKENEHKGTEFEAGSGLSESKNSGIEVKSLRAAQERRAEGRGIQKANRRGQAGPMKLGAQRIT